MASVINSDIKKYTYEKSKVNNLLYVSLAFTVVFFFFNKSSQLYFLKIFPVYFRTNSQSQHCNKLMEIK